MSAPLWQRRCPAQKLKRRASRIATRDLPNLVSSVVHDASSGRATVFALNRAREEMNFEVELRGPGTRAVSAASALHHADLKATNTKSAPDTVSPVPLERVSADSGKVSAVLQPLSFNVIVTER